MDIKQLDYFVHVVELGSFTRAASSLSIAQSALSHQVRRLEVELRQVLLHRNGRGVTPTDAGKRLLAHARGILMQVSRARDELAETREAPVGHVVLGLPPTIARLLTVPLFKAFRGAFPKASLGIVEALSASVVEWLVGGRVDVGLVYNATPSPPIEIIPLREQEMFLVALKTAKGRRQPKRILTRDLPRYPLIVPSRQNANRARIEAQLAYLGLKPQIVLEVDGVASILDLVHEGYGYTILPLNSLRAHDLAQDFAAIRIIDPKLTIQLSMVVSAQRPTTPLTQALLPILRKTAMEVLFPRRP